MNKKVLSGLLVPAIALVLMCAMLIGAGGLFFKPSMQSAPYSAVFSETEEIYNYGGTIGNSAGSGVKIMPAALPQSENTVLLGGYPLGINIRPQGVIITSRVGVVTSNGVVTPLEGVEISSGDLLCAINGEQVRSAEDISRILKSSEGDVTITISHAGNRTNYTVTPAVDSVNGERKLGVMLQEGISGIGTLTFVDSRGRYGALGHPVKDAYGNTVEPESGNIYPAVIKGAIPGTRGKAGELQGVYSKQTGNIGTIDADNIFGIFGEYCGSTENLIQIEIGARETVQPGKAYIYSTLSGTSPRLYEIEIIKAERQNSPLDKSMVIRVTDRELLAKAGGIVQGMSGSPIIQNGKLIGAVTHVLIDDPTKGYGIYAEWMTGR